MPHHTPAVLCRCTHMSTSSQQCMQSLQVRAQLTGGPTSGPSPQPRASCTSHHTAASEGRFPHALLRVHPLLEAPCLLTPVYYEAHNPEAARRTSAQGKARRAGAEPPQPTCATLLAPGCSPGNSTARASHGGFTTSLWLTKSLVASPSPCLEVAGGAESSGPQQSLLFLLTTPTLKPGCLQPLVLISTRRTLSTLEEAWVLGAESQEPGIKTKYILLYHRYFILC